MLQKLKLYFDSNKPISKLAEKTTIKEKISYLVDKIPGSGITLITVVLTVVSMIIGHLLAMAAIAGIVLSISIGFLYVGAPENIKKYILWTCAKCGWYLDVVVTIGLTIMGFHLGATLALLAMVLGTYISMMMSIARWYVNKKPELITFAPISSSLIPC